MSSIGIIRICLLKLYKPMPSGVRFVTSFLMLLQSMKRVQSKPPSHSIDALDHTHKRSFVLTKGSVYNEWADLDIMKGSLQTDGTQRFHLLIREENTPKPLMFRERLPLLACGPHGSPDYLKQILSYHLGQGVPVLTARIPGLSPVYAAHVSRQGVMSMTFTTDACCLANHFILFVDDAQLNQLNKVMSSQQDYDIIRLTLTNGDMMGYPLPPMLMYRSKHHVFAPDGLARSVAALTSKSQHTPLNHDRVIQMAAKIAGVEGTASDIIQAIQRDETLSIKINDAISALSRTDNLDIFIDHRYAA
jgi:hypothetical protein